MIDIVIFFVLFCISAFLLSFGSASKSNVFAIISGLLLLVTGAIVIVQDVGYGGELILSDIPLTMGQILGLFCIPLSLFIIFSNGLDLI